MTESRVHIERLRIRLRGASADRAGTLAAGLAGELARRLAAQGPASGGRVGEVDAGTLRPPAGAGAAEVRRGIAERIAAGITSGRKE